MHVLNRSSFFSSNEVLSEFIPNFAFKKRKKLDPLKTSISQPLWNANFIGLGGCEMKVFNGKKFLLFFKRKIRDELTEHFITGEKT